MTRSFLFLSLAPVFAVNTFAAEKPNLLIITVDDMSADSVGVFGCKLADTTPNIDRLRAAMSEWMKRTQDPVLDAYRQPHDPAAREALVLAQQEEAAAHGPRRRRPQQQN